MHLLIIDTTYLPAGLDPNPQPLALGEELRAQIGGEIYAVAIGQVTDGRAVVQINDDQGWNRGVGATLPDLSVELDAEYYTGEGQIKQDYPELDGTTSYTDPETLETIEVPRLTIREM